MKFFKIGDRVTCYEGNGTIIDITPMGIFPNVYYVELENGGKWYFMRWHLEHLKEETK